MKRKTLLSAILATVIAISGLTGCDPNTENQTQTTTSKATDTSTNDTVAVTVETPVETDPYPTIKNGDITILWHTTEEAYKESLAADPNHIDYVWSIKPEFEAKYGGTVTVIAVPWGDMRPTLISMVSNAEVCDLAESNDQNFPIYPAKNLIQPLDVFLSI